MEHKWYHMFNLTSSVRRGVKIPKTLLSSPMQGGVTTARATATNGCQEVLFVQVTSIDLSRLGRYTFLFFIYFFIKTLVTWVGRNYI